ncbi:TPA: YDG/SRA domain-containing protein [Vibrio vulnificus]
MRVFGEIEDVNVGEIFENRAALAKSGIHPPNQAGISGSAKEGADSIVLSGGYEDDEDYGDVIIYTGAGGRDENSGKQISDQQLERANLALAKNKLESLPVRVSRSHKHPSPFSPKKGYQYAGLYSVDDYWCEVGRSGFKVWRFKLTKMEAQSTCQIQEISGAEYEIPSRREITSNKIVRDHKNAKQVKAFYRHQCQVCGLAISTGAGLYAEAAHIRPLGRPHDGPDSVENLLCLCPNHHVMFDNGVFAIADDYRLIGIEGSLTLNAKHSIDLAFIRYHREHYLL